jgi:hypothetical protein
MRILGLSMYAGLSLLVVSFLVPSDASAQNCRWDGTAPFCSGSCGGGETEITRMSGIPDFWEPPMVNMPADFGAECLTGSKALCCSQAGVTCRWDGTAPFCDGECQQGETVGSPPPGSSSGAGCLTGSKVYCCRSTAANPNPTGTSRSRLEASPEFAVYAAIWDKDQSVAWEARHGLTSDEYQAVVDRLAPQGFRPVEVSGYSVDGQARYATVWEQRQGPAWVARHGLTSDEYQQEFDRLTGEGFAPVSISGYTVGGRDLYAAVWEQRQGPAWVARHGLTSDEYQREFDRLLAEGFRLVDVSGYFVGGTDRYAAIWQMNDGRAWAARHGLTAEQYQREFNALGEQGMRPTLVATWTSDRTPRYAAIWEQRNEPAWVARHGMLSDTYQEEFDRLAQEGYRPVSVSAFHLYQ